MPPTAPTLSKPAQSAPSSWMTGPVRRDSAEGFGASLKDVMHIHNAERPERSSNEKNTDATSQAQPQQSGGLSTDDASVGDQPSQETPDDAQGSSADAQGLPDDEQDQADAHDDQPASLVELMQVIQTARSAEEPAEDMQPDQSGERPTGDKGSGNAEQKHSQHVLGPQQSIRTQEVDAQRREPAPQEPPQQPRSIQPEQRTASASLDEPDDTEKSNRETKQVDARPQPELEVRRDRVDAAVARAIQVQAGVQLENATGQSANTADTSGRSASLTIQGAAAITGNGVNSGGEQAGHLPQQSTMSEERFADRIVRGLTTMINQRGGSMTMRLDPPELGQLRVQMTIARGVVTAQFTPSTAQAHALLEKNIATLRLALENQGLTVDRLNVQSHTPTSQNHFMNDHNADKHQHQHRSDAGGGQSRGRREESQQQGEHAARKGFAGLVDRLNDPGGER